MKVLQLVLFFQCLIAQLHHTFSPSTKFITPVTRFSFTSARGVCALESSSYILCMLCYWCLLAIIITLLISKITTWWQRGMHGQYPPRNSRAVWLQKPRWLGTMKVWIQTISKGTESGLNKEIQIRQVSTLLLVSMWFRRPQVLLRSSKSHIEKPPKHIVKWVLTILSAT